MKIIILLLITFFNLNIALADYKTNSVFKITSLDSVNTGDNNRLVNFTLDITGITDTGITTEGKCVLTIKNNILEGNCENTDQDGDISYTSLYRDVAKGNIGEATRIGGTGKYANKNGTCVYEVIVRNLKLGIGASEGTCPDL
tara:strand:+ start:391 stop:819 length:429 start_codon:yes stop_codon:yes gene_type:complete